MILTATSGESLAKGMGGTHLASFPIFIAAVGLFFMNMLSWAVYVSDYSRYLPRNTSAPRIYWAVFGGNALGACLYGGLGIYITALAPDSRQRGLASAPSRASGSCPSWPSACSAATR